MSRRSGHRSPARTGATQEPSWSPRVAGVHPPLLIPPSVPHESPHHGAIVAPPAAPGSGGGEAGREADTGCAPTPTGAAPAPTVIPTGAIPGPVCASAPARPPGGASAPARSPCGTIPTRALNSGGSPAQARPGAPAGARDSGAGKSLTREPRAGNCRTAHADSARPGGVETSATSLRGRVIDEEGGQHQSRDHKDQSAPHGTLPRVMCGESTRDLLKRSLLCTQAKPGFFGGTFPEAGRTRTAAFR
jgi:translation initiation factor IF-2